MEWPKVESKSSKSLTEYKFNGLTWCLMLIITLMLIAVLLPLFIFLYRGTQPFLPTISQAAGSPPQSGIYCILTVSWTCLAFICYNLMHMGIRIHMKRLKDDRVLNLASFLNNFSLICCHVAFIGAIFAVSYPLDSYITSDEWVKITFVPHTIGAVSGFFGGMFYNMTITYLLFLLHPEQKRILRTRIFINCLTAICIVLIIMTEKDATASLEHNRKLGSCIIDPDSIHYTLFYLICSASEWCAFFTIIAFVITLKDEAKAICFTMTVTLGTENGDEKTVIKSPFNTDHQEDKTVKQS